VGLPIVGGGIKTFVKLGSGKKRRERWGGGADKETRNSTAPLADCFVGGGKEPIERGTGIQEMSRMARGKRGAGSGHAGLGKGVGVLVSRAVRARKITKRRGPPEGCAWAWCVKII